MSTPVIRWPRVNDGNGCVSLGMLTNLRPGADKADELRLTAAFFSPEDNEPFAVIGWGCESCVDGRTERVSHDYYATFDDMRRYSVADAACEVAKYASEKIGVKTDEKLTPEMVREVAAREMRAALALNTEAPAWVLAWAGLDEATAAAFRGKPEKPEACSAEKKPREKKPRAAKVDTEAELIARMNADQPKPAEEVAAETSHSPVKCVEPVAKSVELRPTHFRGVLLLDAAEWEDPSAEGVFVGVSNASYHADKASLSASGLKTFLVSPADYRKEIYEPKGEVAPATQKAFDIGTMTHGFVLEGASLAAMGFALKPDGHNGSSTEGKAWTARMKAEGLRGVDSEMVKTAQELAAAIMADENLRFVGSRAGLSELSVRVRDPRSGAMLRARFDFSPEVGVWLWDIKSTSDADPVEFKKSFFDFGYDFQTVHYTAVAQLAGLPYKAMAFAAVGKPGAHDTALVKFGPMSECEEDWNNARRLVYQAWRDYADCVRTGVWKKRKFDPCIAVAREWQRNARVALIRDEEIPY